MPVPFLWMQADARPLRAAVVRVQGLERWGIGVGRQGSGVVVARGLIATSAHIVKGAASLRVAQDGKSWDALLLALDEAHDVALLRVAACPLPPVEILDEPAAQNLEVEAWGHPLGGPLKRAQGRIQAVWTYRAGAVYQTDVEAQPGSSGSGLFDAEGRLVGLLTFLFPQSPRMVFAVPGRWIRSLLEDPARPQGLPTDTPLLEGFVANMAQEGANGEAWTRFSRTWVTDSPDDPDAWLALGHATDSAWKDQVQRGLGPADSLHQESLAAFQKALVLRGSHARGLNNLGAAQDAGNHFQEAERAFREALRLNPQYGLAWLNLGVTLRNTRRWEESIDAYQKGLALVPDATEGWGQLGDSCLRVKRWPEAAAALRIAIRQAPFRAEFWSDLLLAATKAGDLTLAESAKHRLKDLSRTSGVSGPKDAPKLGTH